MAMRTEGESSKLPPSTTADDCCKKIDEYLARREDERREVKDDLGGIENNPAVSVDLPRPLESPIWPKKRSASDASSSTSHSSLPPKFFTAPPASSNPFVIEMPDSSSERIAGHPDPTVPTSISGPEADKKLTTGGEIALYMIGLLLSIPLGMLYLFTVLGLFILLGHMFWFMGQIGFDAMTSVGRLLLYNNGTVAG